MKELKCVHELNLGVEPTWILKDKNEHLKKCKSKYYSEYFYSIKRKLINSKIELPIIDDCFNIERDPGVIETPSIKGIFQINNKQDYFNKFTILTKFMKINGLTNSTKFKNLLNLDGGCHIHLDLKEIDKVGEDFKKKFLKNLYYFSINNPELNWTCNNPYDNLNANSFLTQKEYVYVREDFRGYFRKRITLIEFLESKLNWTYNKKYSIIERPNFNSIEFRFFMMPRTIKENLLHLNIAIGIYNYIFYITSKDIQLDLKYTKVKDLQNISISQAKENIEKTLHTIGICNEGINYFKKIKFPIMKLRYNWK